MIQESKAYKYCVWCLEENNQKVPQYVKKQCKAWKDITDGLNEDAYVDEKAYSKILKLLKLMVHPDLQCTMDEGLEDYALLLITATFCTKLKNAERDTRYYTTVLLKIARKNFKTFVSGVIFILLMLIEPRFSRFFSVAPDLKLSPQ